MKVPQRIVGRAFGFVLLLLFAVSNVNAQTTGTLRGQIKDELGAVIVGATVSAVDANGLAKNTTSDADGNFALGGLVPGNYIVRVVAPGFAFYENAEVAVAAGRAAAPLVITLGVSLEREEVTVAAEGGISTDSTSNADAIVLRGKDLEALPDDPDDLAAALSALAGPSAGPNGGQIYIDGFTGGRLPPKDAIREVRVNQSPMNAENDRPGFGRIDILTRPGMDRLRGSANTSFADEAFNSRNPFAPARADYQSRIYGFSLSGPIVAKKSSFFVDFQRREEDDNDVIAARVLDPVTEADTGFNLAVLTPRRFTTFSPRFDYAFNQNHTLIARYSYTRSSNLGGIGAFNLLSRAVDFASTRPQRPAHRDRRAQPLDRQRDALPVHELAPRADGRQPAAHLQRQRGVRRRRRPARLHLLQREPLGASELHDAHARRAHFPLRRAAARRAADRHHRRQLQRHGVRRGRRPPRGSTPTTTSSSARTGCPCSTPSPALSASSARSTCSGSASRARRSSRAAAARRSSPSPAARPRRASASSTSAASSRTSGSCARTCS